MDCNDNLRSIIGTGQFTGPGTHGHGPVVPLSCRVNQCHLTGAASQQSGTATQLTVTRTPNPGPGPGIGPATVRDGQVTVDSEACRA